MASAHSPSRTLNRFFRLLAPEKKDIGLVYIYAVLSGLINLTLPLGIQAIIGLTLANTLSTSWVLLIVLVTLGTVAAGVIQILQISITEVLQQRLFARASFEYTYRIPRLRVESLKSYYPPELVNRFFDTMTIQKGIPKILIDFSTAILQIFFGLLLLSFYHPFFVFFAVFLVVTLTLIIRYTGPRGLYTSLEESDYKYGVVFWLEEIARTLTTFKLAGVTDFPMKKSNGLVTKYLDARKKHFKVLVFQYSNIVFFKTIITAGLLVMGSLLLIDRQINLGQFVASEIVIILIIGSVEKLVLSADTVYDVLTATEKVAKITDIPLEPETGVSFESVNTGKGMAVEFRNTTLEFADADNPSLENFNLLVQPGEKICISGASGSGKTLLVHLLSGFYDTYSGVIIFNGIPQSSYNLRTLRSHIGDCLTQKLLFRGTIEENLTLGNPNISYQDITRVLDQLGALEEVQQLPQAFQTVITPEGRQLSNTVGRKLILAKCALKKPQLLLMDNFLSSLAGEEQVRIGRFVTSNPDWTLVAISNNPRFAAMCDRVVVMDGGKIADIGPLEELASKPYYSKIFGATPTA